MLLLPAVCVKAGSGVGWDEEFAVDVNSVTVSDVFPYDDWRFEFSAVFFAIFHLFVKKQVAVSGYTFIISLVASDAAVGVNGRF